MVKNFEVITDIQNRSKFHQFPNFTNTDMFHYSILANVCCLPRNQL